MFPREPRDTMVELFAGGNWVSVDVADLYGREPMTVSRGRPDESQAFTPSRCEFTLGNRSGKYNPRNPLGPYYGQIGRNTPIRVCVRTGRDDFTRVVSGGWGTSTSGHPYTAIGSGGTVQASDFNVSGTQGTHSVPAANAWRATYIPLTSLKHREVEVAVTVTVPVSNVTGGNLEPANILFRVSNTPTYYRLRVSITTAEAVTLEVINSAGSLASDLFTVPGLTHSAGQALRVRAQFEGQTIRARVWPAASAEPYVWHLTTQTLSSVPAGGVGIYSGVRTGNTNTLPIVFSYDDLDVRVPRFFGEVSTWNQAWSDGTVDAVTMVDAAGVSRRLGQGSAPLASAPYRAMLSAATAVAYWPLEDLVLSTAGRPAIGNAAPMMHNGDVPDESRLWGQGDLAPWLPKVLSRQGINSLSAGGIIDKNFANDWTVGWAMAGGKAYNDVLIQTARQNWIVDFSQTANTVRVIDLNGTVKSLTYPQLFDGGLHTVELFVHFPGSVAWDLIIDGNSALTETSISGSVEPVGAVTFRNRVDNSSAPLSIGHIVVGANQLDAAFGNRGETASERILRLCTEEGIAVSAIGDPLTTAEVGPQYQDALLALIVEAAIADQGELYEPRGTSGVEYRTRRSLYNQTATLALDFTADHLAPPLQPVDDDQVTRNDVTVTRRDGGTHQEVQQTGPLAITAPQSGGIGRYDTQLTVNVAVDSQLPDMAGWLLMHGTFDGARYPQVRVSLGRPAIANDPAMAHAAMDVNIGDRITIANATALTVYDTITLIVRGISESIDAFEHLITFNCTPETPYEVIRVDTAGMQKANTGGAILHAGVNSTATTLDVATTVGPPWVTAAGQMPIPLTISGEAVSATAIADSLFTFVAAGTAAHAVNASVTPALPSGIADGDLLLVYAAIRNTTGVPDIPAGYTVLHDNVNARLFGKIATAGESAPTVTFTGGVAGADTSAQMAAFRGKLRDINRLVVNANGHANASGQDIPLTALTVPYDNCLILYLGWKQDDWTSVTSPGTEIGEPSTATGSDQGIVWSYTIQTTAATVTATSFTVTGGAAAVSRAGVVAIRCDRQTFTVTRGVNGVHKTLAAAAPVALTRRATVGL